MGALGRADSCNSLNSKILILAGDCGRHFLHHPAHQRPAAARAGQQRAAPAGPRRLMQRRGQRAVLEGKWRGGQQGGGSFTWDITWSWGSGTDTKGIHRFWRIQLRWSSLGPLGGGCCAGHAEVPPSRLDLALCVHDSAVRVATRLLTIPACPVLASLQWQREKERNPSNHRPKVRGGRAPACWAVTWVATAVQAGSWLRRVAHRQQPAMLAPTAAH